MYHKFAEVEIEVCEDDFDDYRFETDECVTATYDYLIDKEEMYYEQVEEALSHIRVRRWIW